MSEILFSNPRLIDPVALTDGPGWILVKDGRIADIGKDGDPEPNAANAVVVDCGGHCLAPGIVDIGVKVSEPGERQDRKSVV